ncbi:integral peroxisomal membrane protein [Niveomyces insectorum RCEF 264]|uniref:Integral peroxisomal membrane protein n=1 Tax=Niveomyces insectorum RCEF 264 TaxID=1081102 RepID=A0A167Y2Z0_9HYPO|nr:integral peroxisomal membrane protein [Niveomyces insectorum RCEF 264]
MSASRSSFLRADQSDRHNSSNPTSPSPAADNDGSGGNGNGGGGGDAYYAPKPTYAAFSPASTLAGAKTASSAAKRRSTVLIHQKSPLLLATPPQVTRALAYSHPFLLPLNKLAGLLSWTTGDPWQSFLLVLLWWFTVLYGDTLIRLAGPIFLVLTLIAGMYGRRYSPLSTSGWSSDDASMGTGGSSSGNANNGGGGSGGSSTGTGGLGYFLFGIGGGGGSGGGGAGREVAAAAAAAAKNRSRAKNLSVDNARSSAVGGGSTAREGGHQRSKSDVITNTRHQKTLDEIVETLKEFTTRCNLLLEPLLELTDFLSTQSTPISATTRPALTVLFVRILLCTPFWFLLTLPPLRIITTRRVALVFGTLILTWHSRAMRVSRTILWRSATVRRTAALVTGLEFEGPTKPTKTPSYVTAGGTGISDPAATPASAAAALQSKLSSTKPTRRLSTPRESELTKAIRRARAGHDAGVRFTFILFENQRRWMGLGWTTSLFAYERPAWTDEHNNAVPSKDDFELPEVEDGSKMRWRWVEGSRWRVDGVVDDAVRVEKTGRHGEHMDTWDYDGDGGRMGWVYYDNKWQNGRRGQEGWSRWTRRRKWYRDAELVEVSTDDTTLASSDDEAQASTPTASAALPRAPSPSPSQSGTAATSSTAVTSASEGVPVNVNGAADKKGANADTSNTEGTSDNADAVSIMSSSSKSASARFKAPSLRRRMTDASARGVAAPAVTTAAVATAVSTNNMNQPRRNSEREEDAAALSSSVGVRLHETASTSWGIGDEAHMGLD